MAAKIKKPTQSSASRSGDAWRPRIDSESEFNPFAGTSAAGSHFGDASEEERTAPVPDATQDTSPLQGSLDRSDADSLTTVAPAAPAAAPAAAPRRAPRRRPARAKSAPKAKRKVKARSGRAKTARSKAKGTARAKSARAASRRQGRGKAKAKTKTKAKVKAKAKTKAKTKTKGTRRHR